MAGQNYTSTAAKLDTYGHPYLQNVTPVVTVDLKLYTFSSLIKVTSFANECDKETTDQTKNVTTKADATRTTVDFGLVGRALGPLGTGEQFCNRALLRLLLFCSTFPL